MTIAANNIIAIATGGVFTTINDLVVAVIGDTPSSVVAQYLIETTLLLTTPDLNEDFPLYIGSMPDADNVKSDCAAIYDTSGLLDGRLMASGEVIEHYGIQVKVRSVDYETGWKKLTDVATQLDALDSVSLTNPGGTTYTLHNMTRTTPVVSLGPEEGTRRRYLFTVNYLLTMEKN